MRGDFHPDYEAEIISWNLPNEKFQWKENREIENSQKIERTTEFWIEKKKVRKTVRRWAIDTRTIVKPNKLNQILTLTELKVKLPTHISVPMEGSPVWFESRGARLGSQHASRQVTHKKRVRGREKKKRNSSQWIFPQISHGRKIGRGIGFPTFRSSLFFFFLP